MTTDTILAKNPRYAQCTKGPWSVLVEQGTMGEVVKVVAKVPLTEEQKQVFHTGLVAQGWHYETICDNEQYYPCALDEENAQIIADAKLNAAKATLLEPAFGEAIAALRAYVSNDGTDDAAAVYAKGQKALQAAAEVTKQLEGVE